MKVLSFVVLRHEALCRLCRAQMRLRPLPLVSARRASPKVSTRDDPRSWANDAVDARAARWYSLARAAAVLPALLRLDPVGPPDRVWPAWLGRSSSNRRARPRYPRPRSL